MSHKLTPSQRERRRAREGSQGQVTSLLDLVDAVIPEEVRKELGFEKKVPQFKMSDRIRPSYPDSSKRRREENKKRRANQQRGRRKHGR